MHSIHASLIAVAVLAAPSPEHVDCSTIDTRYTAVVEKVMGALRTYEKCVASSDKRSDCAAEIQALDTAHDDFVDIVDDAKDCR